MKHSFNTRIDGAIATLIAGVAFVVYLLTLAPGVISLNDDTLEFQLVAVRGAIPHPSGYPLYAILLTLFVRLFPVGEMAWRANLLSAIFGAIAVGFTYLAARRLLHQGMHRLAAIGVAGLFAFAPTFWSQATVAEVYTLHIAIMAALVLRVLTWMHSEARNPLPPDVLFLLGLGMAHHRMIVLWVPAVVVGWMVLFFRNDRRKTKEIALPSLKQLAIGIVAVVLPLTLYLWLPLRSDVGSIDGTYQHVGFTCWVTACQYTEFFGENSLEKERPPLFFAEQTLQELGWVGVPLALVGMVWLVRIPFLSTLFLITGFVPHLLFALLYRVPDPEVFWMPGVWMLALFVGVGVNGLIDVIQGSKKPSFQQQKLGFLGIETFLGGVIAILLIGIQLGMGWGNADRSDLTGDPRLNGVPFNGYDILNQPLPPNGVVIGLLGETTYLRYLQEAEGVAPQIQTAGGDDPAQRAAAIDAAFVVGSRPFLTRELAGLENRYSLSALGSLIEVLEVPRTEVPEGLFPAGQTVTESISLVGWTRSPMANSELQRLTVAWRVTQPITVDLQVSARVVGEGDIVVCATCQIDRPPVWNAYPTSHWRTGEIILDTYELPAPTVGSHYLLIFYLPATGAEVGRAIITP